MCAFQKPNAILIDITGHHWIGITDILNYCFSIVILIFMCMCVCTYAYAPMYI